MNNLKSVLDGARAMDGANLATDLKIQSLNANTNINTTSVDMSGHCELLVFGHVGTLGASSSAVLVVQESNEANANFTTIANASISLNTANSTQMLSVNWRHPDRKKYARLQLQPAISNPTLLGAHTLRVQPTMGPVNIDSGMAQV